MLHESCTAHGLHKLECFPDINTLLSSDRKICLKGPARIQKFIEIMQCELPPNVMVIRQGTWINEALFLANKFEIFNDVINELPADSQ